MSFTKMGFVGEKQTVQLFVFEAYVKYPNGDTK